MTQVVSGHVNGTALTLTFTPPLGNVALLYGAKVTALAGLATVADEVTITGLTGGTLYEKIEVLATGGNNDPFDLPDTGIPATGANVDIVLTVPALTGVALAGWMIVDSVPG